MTMDLGHWTRYSMSQSMPRRYTRLRTRAEGWKIWSVESVPLKVLAVCQGAHASRPRNSITAHRWSHGSYVMSLCLSRLMRDVVVSPEAFSPAPTTATHGCYIVGNGVQSAPDRREIPVVQLTNFLGAGFNDNLLVSEIDLAPSLNC